jgi:hypothetical protein
MDPITLIVKALTAGATFGLEGTQASTVKEDTEASPVKDAYKALKALVRTRFADRPDAELVLTRYEQAPEAWEAQLAVQLTTIGAGNDAELLKAAQTLMRLVERPSVWNRRRPINYPKQIEMAGGFAAPLIAGFSLTTVAQLVVGRDHPWLSDWAIALFAIAAVLLINAVQLAATTLGYAATPSERLDYNPEAAFKPHILYAVRARQWEEMDLRAKYTERTRYCYNLGFLAFLGGLGLLLVPNHSWPWPWGRLVGVTVVTISLIIDVMSIASNAHRPKWLLPTTSSISPDKLSDEGAKYLFTHPDASGLQRLRRASPPLSRRLFVRAKRSGGTRRGSPGLPN